MLTISPAVRVYVAEVEAQHIERAGEDADVVGRNRGVHVGGSLGQGVPGGQERETQHRNTEQTDGSHEGRSQRLIQGGRMAACRSHRPRDHTKGMTRNALVYCSYRRFFRFINPLEYLDGRASLRSERACGNRDRRG